MAVQHSTTRSSEIDDEYHQHQHHDDNDGRIFARFEVVNWRTQDNPNVDRDFVATVGTEPIQLRVREDKLGFESLAALAMRDPVIIVTPASTVSLKTAIYHSRVNARSQTVLVTALTGNTSWSALEALKCVRNHTSYP